jgi:hypothetical protein
MTTRTTSPLAGIGWLRNALNLGGRDPRTLLLAALCIVGVSLLPQVVTLPLQLLYPNNMPVLVGVMAFSLLVGLLLSPVFAGFLQVIDAIENGRPARARDVFAPYRNGVAKPVIGFSLLLWVLYAAMFVVMALSVGPEVRDFYVKAIQVGQPTQLTPAQAQVFMGGFLRAVAIGIVFGILISGLWTIALGQIAIARQRVLPSFVDGLAGTLKNLPAILVLIVVLFLLAIAVMIVFAILAVILGLIGKLVGEWMSFVLLVPLYLALMLGMYVLTFGLAYNFWRDVCGGTAQPAVAVTEA